MAFRRFASLVSVVLLALASTSSLTVAQECKTARVRRSWTALSPIDRELYKDAIAMSMDSGAYIKFVEVHTEMMSEREAHAQCMFIYWHRAFLTAFESMLRGQHPRFACITVPYWDWVTDYSKFASGQCTNLLECSPALSFLGGRAPVALGRRNVTINGKRIEGYCAADAPLNHFCQDSKSTGATCVQCLPRGDWLNATFPATASFASVRAQLFNASTIGEMSTAIELGAHNNLHGKLGGAMGVFESPADPVFWSHHATVDLLHSIFHKCKVGEQQMTLTEKIASPGWSTCQRRNSTMRFEPADRLTMRTGFNGSDTVDAAEDPLIGEYIVAVPQHYAALMDIRDLGASSYTYEVEGLLGSLFTECGATGTADPTQSAIQKVVQVTSDLGANATAAPLQPLSASAMVQQVQQVQVLAPPPTIASLINTTIEPASQQVAKWAGAADGMVLRLGGDAVREVEKMACLFQDECLGGVSTYSPEFKKQFRITGEPRCKQIIDRIHAGVDVVTVAEWKTHMVATFGCPKPKTTVNPAAQNTIVIVTPAPTPRTPCPDAATQIAQTNAKAVAYAHANNKEASPALTITTGNAKIYVDAVAQHAP